MKRIRPARHYQHPQAPVRVLADRAIPPIARALRTTLKAGRRLFDAKRAEYLLREGRVREVADLMDVHHQVEAMRHPLAMIGDVWLEGGKLGARKINGVFTSHRRVVRFKKETAHREERQAAGGGEGMAGGRSRQLAILDHESFLASVAVTKDQADLFNFDRFDPVTQQHIRDFQDALISQLGVDSRATIEETILQAMRLGLTPAQIVDRIRSVIGLTDRQALAVNNFRTMLETMDAEALNRSLAGDMTAFKEARAAGKSLADSTIDQMVMNYADNYLDYRALQIATTESTTAASVGLQGSYQQAVDRGVFPAEAVTQHWLISMDEKTCDHCLSVVDLNPDGVGLGEDFDSDEGPVSGPAMHPSCRCSLEFVTNLDMVPDDTGDEG